MNQLHIHHRVNETERLITAERHGMLQYACYRLGNLDDAEDAISLLALSCVRRVMPTSTSFANTAGRGVLG